MCFIMKIVWLPSRRHELDHPHQELFTLKDLDHQVGIDHTDQTDHTDHPSDVCIIGKIISRGVDCCIGIIW